MRTVLAFCAVFVIAGCGNSSPPPPEAPLSSHADPVARASPAPVITWGDSKFSVTTLPAVARGGEVAVVAVHDGDAGRGWPNLRIEVRDRNDAVIQKIPVMISNEYETLVVDGAPSPALQQRIDAANRELATLHGVHDLVAMHALELQKPTAGEAAHFAIGDGIDVDFNGDHLHVFHHNTDHSLALQDATTWLVKDHKACPTCEPCGNPAFLDGVFHATGINMIVVQVAYVGTDTCWEPGDQVHVVSW